MNDAAENQNVAVYTARGGALVLLTGRQEAALQRACVWQTLGYRFIRWELARPTHCDREVLTMCRTYKYITHIGLLHPEYRSSDAPYLVSNPDQFEPSAACVNFTDAVKCSRELFRCDLVTVKRCDYQPSFDCVADLWRVSLLIV